MGAELKVLTSKYYHIGYVRGTSHPFNINFLTPYRFVVNSSQMIWIDYRRGVLFSMRTPSTIYTYGIIILIKLELNFD